MVLEFRGEVVRAILADLRERGYRRQGRDCFFFNFGDAMVLDSTFKGHFGRFINHCCLPSMYTKASLLFFNYSVSFRNVPCGFIMASQVGRQHRYITSLEEFCAAINIIQHHLTKR